MSDKIEFFVEKYRPQTWEELVFKDKLKLKKNIEQNRIPHLLLYSEVGGTGKGSIVNIIKKQFKQSFSEVDCSINGGKDYLSKIVNETASTKSMFSKRRKILFIDEVNKLSPEAFEILKIPLEKYVENFMVIIATNNIGNIPQPVLSRFFKIDLSNPNEGEILERLKFICEKENIRYNEKRLKEIIEEKFPSIREMIIYIQANQDELNDAIEENIEMQVPTNNQIESIWRRYIKELNIISILEYCKKYKLNYYEVVNGIAKKKIKNIAGNKTNEVQRLLIDYKNKLLSNPSSNLLMEEFLYKFDKILSKK